MKRPPLIEHDDGVDRATLNRPDSVNALDPGTFDARNACFDSMVMASPTGLRLSKECLNMSVDAGSIEAVIAMEDRHQALCSRSEGFNEGHLAFLEKRKPVYIRR